MNLHQKIANALMEQVKASESPLQGLIDVQDIQQVCRTIFPAYRGSSEGGSRGFRLSEVGLQLMRAFFKCYNVDLSPGYKQTFPHIIYLDRVAKMPYFMNDECCVLFDSELAMMLRLSEGKLQDLIDARFRLTSSEDFLNPNM